MYVNEFAKRIKEHVLKQVLRRGIKEHVRKQVLQTE